MTNVVTYLENSASIFPDKPAFVDEERSMTFRELRCSAMRIATRILKLTCGQINVPAAVLLKKSVDCVAAFMGVTYAGGLYTPLDEASPQARLQKITETLKPGLIVTDDAHADLARSLGFSEGRILLLRDCAECEIEEAKILEALAGKIDTDPLYVLFTSGSTGTPRGVTICHRSVIGFIEWACNTFQFTENTRFGNQAPFYFDNSILDIYSTLKTGATTYIMPEKFFMSPVKLMEHLNEKQINTIFWVPSALIYVSNSGVLEKLRPRYLKKVLFCGEIMPNRQLNLWRRALPSIQYVNLYGMAETTNACAYFIVDRPMRDYEPLPIGFPCANTDLLVLNEENERVRGSETGELCVRGTSLAFGYYNDPEKKAAAFVQNPLNRSYPDLIYRTGDLVRYDERGELIYLGRRRDPQIKRMGHRIEIGEIEAAVLSLPGLENGRILYDDAENCIILFYQSSTLDDSAVLLGLRKLIPKYMLPNKLTRLDALPLDRNGKIDRAVLEDRLRNLK